MRTYISDDTLFAFKDGVDDKLVFRQVKERIDKNAKFIRTLVDVDGSPVVLYELNGIAFSLIYDPMMDTHIYCKDNPNTLLEIERIILN